MNRPRFRGGDGAASRGGPITPVAAPTGRAGVDGLVVISLDGTSPVPPFEQVRSQFAAQIAGHHLVAGTRLPTVRRLAADLGLAVNTVARAYRELETAGLVETRGRAGTFVSAGGEPAREQLQRAAQDYAALAHDLGLEGREALNLVRAAIATAAVG
jgi:DNA-binding transcriptional regulator YhcF (GntR family)